MIISAFVLGLAGSLHCVGMCGPLVMAMPFHAEKGKSKVIAIGIYFLSKSLAYAILGILVGSIGKGFSLVIEQRLLSILAGALIIIFALIPVLKKHPYFGNAFNNRFSSWYGSLLQMPSTLRFSGLGFLNGLLPCGIVYAALAAALAIAGPWESGLFMFFFGIGTAPALLFIILVKKLLGISLRQKLTRATLFVSLLLGSLLIVRGMSIGIPYISPAHQHGVVQPCCQKP